jgi:hypothetical protein
MFYGSNFVAMSNSTKIVFIGRGNENRIEWNVVHNAFKELNDCDVFSVDILSSKSSISYTIKSLIGASVVIVHSPLVLSLPYILFASIRGCKIYAFIWDFYPVRIYNKYYKFGLKRFLKDKVENWLLYLVDKLIFPSDDFKVFYPLFDRVKIRIWPKIGSVYVRSPISINDNISNIIKIVFAGQINETRGLAESISLIKTKINDPFVVYVASASDNLDEYLMQIESVVFLGKLNECELIELYKKCNFGLVSLSLGFEGPAFPSKTFDYLSSGLPILYCGPYLHDYLSMISDSGVGADVSSLTHIDMNLFNSLICDFSDKTKKFESLACFDVQDLKNLLIKDERNEFQK